jgi:DNA-binding winged helix-turn-helix (wHTH) protein/Tol biopolymer transport system component
LATGPELQPGRVFSFGPFELSETDAELHKNGMRIKLQDQPYQVLIQLVANPGRIVTREELQQKLWPADTFVDFDLGLNSAVRKLRQALGDDADHPRYIETLAKRGYRFIAPVIEEYDGPTTAAPAPVLVAQEAPPSPLPLTEVPVPAKKKQRYLFDLVCALIFAALSFIALHNSSRAIPTLINEHRITSNPEEAPIFGAVVSPDGRYVAYSDPTGAYFREIDSGETHALKLPIGEDWVPTSWYPDSTHLLLSSRHVLDGPERMLPDPNAYVWRLSILGGAPQRIAEAASAGAVSPDGSHIAFLRGPGGFERRQIWLADIASDTPTQSMISGASDNVVSEVSWSPHGIRVAYIRVYRKERELWAIETLDVKTHVAKVVKISSRLAPALSWGPDGRLFYGYQREQVGERSVYSVFALQLNEKTGEVQGKESQLTEGMGVIGGMSISADGKRLVLWRDNTRPQSFVTEIDPATQKFRPLRRLTLDQNTSVVTAWTPDSRSIIFSSNRSGASKLYRQAIDQTVPDLLVDGERILLARLAPDRSHILYMVETDAEHTAPLSIMQVPLDGGSPRLLLQNSSLSDIQCARSPANLCLLCTTGPAAQVFAFDPNTGDTWNFALPIDGYFQQWSLSPDGTTLALLMPGPKLLFMNTATKAVREVKAGNWSPLIAIDWAPDGKSVYVPSRKSDGGYVLLGVQLDGTTRVVLDSGMVPRFQWAIPASDGRHIAVQAITGENNVWMVERF